MKKILSWIPSVPFLILFGSIALVFHPIQLVALAMGYQPHKSVVDIMIWCLNRALLVMGYTRKITFKGPPIPKGKSLLIVSNHGGMFDIPVIGEVLADHHPKYVAKKELAHGWPSISLNIREGGSVSIDRKNNEQAIAAIERMGRYIEKHNRSAVIFPEGTRTRTGQMKRFKSGGLVRLIETAPNALIVPVALTGFWEIEKWGLRPLPFGLKLGCTILPIIDRKNKSAEELAKEIETSILNELGQTQMELAAKID